MRRVTYDPRDPSFPHGTPRGRRRGCDCAPCDTALARRDKRNRVARAAGLRPARVDPALTGRARLHLAGILASTPGATLADVSRASGASWGTVKALAENERAVSSLTAQRVLAVTPDSLAAARRLVDAARLIRTARSLEALGYPLPWQARRSTGGLARIVREGHVLVRPADEHAIVALAARIGDRPADASDGLSAEQIEAARTAAHAAGFYPPICYDEETGELLLEALPDHRWARSDAMATRRLTALRMILAGAPHLETAQAVDTARRNVQRIRARVDELVNETVATLGVSEEEASARVRDKLDDLLVAWESGEQSATLTGLRTGVVKARAVAHDHPDLAAWRSEQDTGVSDHPPDAHAHALAA